MSYGQFVYWSKKIRKKVEACLILVQIEAQNQKLYSYDEAPKKQILCTVNLNCGHKVEVHNEKALLLILKELK